MRNIKSFLMSGIMLCVLYLIVHSTFFSTGSVDDTQTQGKKIYSPFTLSSAMDAEHTDVEEHHDIDAAPSEEVASTPVEEAAPTEAPSQEVSASDQPAAPVEAPSQEVPSAQPAAPATSAAPATPAAAPAQAIPAPAAPATPAAAPAQATPAPVGQIPEAPSQEVTPPPPPEEGKEELIGFDTIDLAEPSGNWLLKRGIWERSQVKYEQVKGVFDQVLESRMPFFKRRAEIDRQILDPLYISAGLDQQEITSILEEFNALLSVDHERHNKQLDERELKMQEAAIEEKKVLEQLQKDVAALDMYSAAIDAFLDKLIEQVNLGRTAEKQAWQLYKGIGQELNDKKARELYDTMATPLARLTNIQGYINGIFKQEFDKVDKTIQDNATRIKNALQSLKEKGLDLKKFSKELDDKLGHEEKVVCPMQEEPEEEGWLGMLNSWWNSFQEGIVGIYDSIIGYFTGAEPEEEMVVVKKKKSATKKVPEPAKTELEHQ